MCVYVYIYIYIEREREGEGERERERWQANAARDEADRAVDAPGTAMRRAWCLEALSLTPGSVNKNMFFQRPAIRCPLFISMIYRCVILPTRPLKSPLKNDR